MSTTVIEGAPVTVTTPDEGGEHTVSFVPRATYEGGTVTLDPASDKHLRDWFGKKFGGSVLHYDARNRVSRTSDGRRHAWMGVAVTVSNPEQGVIHHADHVTDETSYLGLDQTARSILGAMAMAQPTERVR